MEFLQDLCTSLKSLNMLVTSSVEYPALKYRNLITTMEDLLELVERMFSLCFNIYFFVALRSSVNAFRTYKAPPVLPHELGSLSYVCYYELVRERKDVLSCAISGQDITKFEKHFLSYCMEHIYVPRATFSRFDCIENEWDTLVDKYRNPRHVCGYLTTVLPGTALVELYLSYITHKNDDHRQSLGMLSLSGTMHSKWCKSLKMLL